MEKKLLAAQTVLLAILLVAVGVFLYALWQLLFPQQKKMPNANARFVSVVTREVQV